MSVTEVNCPTCDKVVIWGEKTLWRPFCCERCKLIDLGDWADESYQISGGSLSDRPKDENL